MKHIQNFAEGLVEEGLSEAAGTFFGKRKRLEDQILMFEEKCKELRTVGEQVIVWGHALSFLFPEGDSVADFYTAIGVDPCDARHLMGGCWKVDFVFPRALFARKRYSKTVYRLYCQLYDAWELYQHGRYYDDPSRPGGKKQTVNLGTMRDWAKRLDDTIESVNRDNQASQVLQFAKQFRLGENEKERIAGADLCYTIDNDLAFPAIDMDACDFLLFPQLPEPLSVKQAITTFCNRLYASHKEMIKNIMDEVKQ